MDQWYAARDKEKKGPFSRAQLQSLADKGALRPTDRVLAPGTKQWIAARQVPDLFAAPSVVAPRRVLWFGLAAGGVGLAALAVGAVLAFGGWFNPKKAIDQAAPIHGEPVSSKAEAPPVDPPQPTAASKVPAASPVKLPKVAAAVAPAEELPPVGPIKTPPVDTVAVKAKLARAAYHKEVIAAANELLTAARLKQDEINKSNGGPNKQAQPTNGLNPFAPNGGLPMPDEYHKFYQGGGLPSGKAFEPAVADYWKARNAAAKKLGDSAEEGLAEYEKQGVADEAKLRPLRAMQLAGQHADLLGMWGRFFSKELNRREVWVVDFDEKTGGFQVEGIDHDQVGVYGVYHGEKVQVKKGSLSFVAARVDANTEKVGPGGAAITMTLKDGKLHYQGAVLERTDEARSRVELIDDLKKAGIDGLEHNESAMATANQVAQKLDLTDANAVWRCQAQLASFAYYGSQNYGPLPHEALYIPYRSSHMTVSPGAYGGLTDMLLNRGPGAGVNQDRTHVLLSAYDKLAEASHPFLKRTTAQELSLCRTRLRLALADEQYGNTPASSVRQFQQTVLIPYVQYDLQRDADRAELQESLEREHPGYEIQIVGEVPLSGQSKQKLRQFAKGVGGMAEDIKNRAMVSGLLAYADMAAADQAASLWQTRLLPLAQKSAGPEAGKPLLEIKADWRQAKGKKGPFLRLADFHLQNVSGQDLTSVVVEVIALNPWGENASHYYYLNQLGVGDFVTLLPNPRWEKRRLDFTNNLTVTWSVWADQGRMEDRQVKLTSPKPNPNVGSMRNDFLKFDEKYQAEGEALGAVMQSAVALPINPASQRNLLREAAAPGKGYVFRMGGEGKSGRTLVLRFRRNEAGPGGVEAEVFDPGNHEPLRAQTPIWKGQFDGNGAIIAFGVDVDWKQSGWAFAIGPDDGLRILCPAAGKPNAVFPKPETPLFAVRLPKE